MFRICPLIVRLAIAGSCAAIAACQGMYIHNADRAAVATTAKKSIDAVDVASISKTEQENLAKLLEEEIKAIDDRSRLVATLAALDFAASDQSIAKQYQQALKKMELALHTKNMLALKDRSDCLIRQKFSVSDDSNLKGMLSGYGAANIPICSTNMTRSLQRPDGLSAADAKDFDFQYSNYVGNCTTLMNACGNVLAIKDLNDARQKLAETQKQERAYQGELDKARTEYQTLLKANKGRTDAAGSTEEQIRGKAKSLLDAVDKLAKASPTLANRFKGRAVVDLLTAAATGKADSTNPDFAPALEVAKSIPSLAESIETAKAQKAMVPVSHLLLALNNLTIQAERDERLRALDAEEISVIERKVEALDAQAQLWRKYSDNLCNLVLLSAGKGHPGKSCDTIGLPGDIPESHGGRCLPRT